jgi:type II secretion system (T2SS) protein E
VALELARRLLRTDAVDPDALATALLESEARQVALATALLSTGALDAPRLERVLEGPQGPFMESLVPYMALVRALPPGICERLLAVPVGRNPATGAVDVAFVQPTDGHAIQEMAYWLQAPVQPVRTTLGALRIALASSSDSETRANSDSIRPPATGQPDPSSPVEALSHSSPAGPPSSASPVTERGPFPSGAAEPDAAPVPTMRGPLARRSPER